MWRSLLAIALGSIAGGMLRWGLSARLNGLYAAIPPGTLAANLLGAYIVGLAVAFFASAPGLAPQWRLLLVTGFCGALTTFSTFAVEVVSLLQQRRMATALGALGLHLGGSLLLAAAGMASWEWLRRRY